MRTTRYDSKKVLALTIVFLFLIISTYASAARPQEAQTQQKPSLAMQFVNSFTCMVTQCGWPAIVFIVLPAIAVYIWKKVFSWG